ncbi:MAG: hypothetical protein GW783_03015 [Deltaproteobacteria bacterium]|nr:hypothetical protein [Deltaproteobacteria bacterium]NCP96271.1 hypothetical protein [Deltaproteobacteria bacterium]NCS73088.1 hypothetical protein [Deltaproteobacteria bacterium]
MTGSHPLANLLPKGSDTEEAVMADQGSLRKGLSSEKREDLWAVILALVVLLVALVAPQGLHDFFSTALYLF